MNFLLFLGFVISPHEIFVASNTGIHQIIANVKFFVDLLAHLFSISLFSSHYHFIDINATETLDLAFVHFPITTFSDLVSLWVIDQLELI